MPVLCSDPCPSCPKDDELPGPPRKVRQKLLDEVRACLRETSCPGTNLMLYPPSFWLPCVPASRRLSWLNRPRTRKYSSSRISTVSATRRRSGNAPRRSTTTRRPPPTVGARPCWGNWYGAAPACLSQRRASAGPEVTAFLKEVGYEARPPPAPAPAGTGAGSGDFKAFDYSAIKGVSALGRFWGLAPGVAVSHTG